jgi:hypothetical protein
MIVATNGLVTHVDVLNVDHGSFPLLYFFSLDRNTLVCLSLSA